MKFLKKSTDHRILECRIMRNLQPGRQQYRSLGYGFVAFTNHENALSVLYGLNNNPNAFPPSNRRPIVEFSLENMRALQLKQKRAEKCLMLQSKTKESSSTPQLFTKNVQRNPQKTKSILTSKSSNSTIYKKSKMNNNPNYNNKLKKKLYLSKNNTQQKSSILPKHFGPKKRHRHRGRLAAAAAASKPKQKKTRKQKRAAKNT
ncbi:RNA-binding protein 28 [Schistosoma haematobium]|nr:RNA-binding protein 28 [Schistosoma haematobium]KAH9580297.1 RNA-binding protein 28 [Schistosoma haematobium]